MDGYHIPSFADWKEQDVMNIKVYQDSQGNTVYGVTDGVKVSQDSQKVCCSFTDGGEPKESMDAGGGGETWQEGLCRHREEMEMDMLRFEVEDAVLDPDALLDKEKKTEEGAAFGKANVAPASASLVHRNTLIEPFDKGQSHTYHKMKMKDTLGDRRHRKLKTAQDEPEPAAKFLARMAARGRIAACCQNDEDM